MITVTYRPQWLLGCAAVCLATVVGCGGGSPEQAFKTWATAVQSGDFPATWGALTPQTRGTVLQIMVLDSDLLSAENPAAKLAFGTVFAKFGVNPQQAGFAQDRLQVTDAAEYAHELDKVLRHFQSELSQLEGSRYQKLSAIWAASAQASLAPSQQAGTRATAAVQGPIPHTAANAQVQAVFENVNGQWLFAELEENSGAGTVAGGPAVATANTPANPPAANPPAASPPPAAGMPPGAGGAAMPPGDAKAMPGGLAAGAAPPAGAGATPPDPALAAATPPTADPRNMPAAAGAMPAGPNAKPKGIGFSGAERAMPAAPGSPAAPGAPAAGTAKGGEEKAMAGDPAAAAAGAGLAKAGGEKAMPANPGAAAGGNPEDGDAPPPPGAGRLGGLMLGRNGEGGAKNMPANGPGANGPGAAGPGAAAIGANAAERDGPAGAGNAGGFGGNQARAKQGTWLYAVETFQSKLADGDYSGLEYIVSTKAKGLLKQIREDDVSPEKKEELKAVFAEAATIEGSAKNTGAAIALSLKGKLGHTIQLSVGKEKDEFKIRELKIHEPGATKKR